MLSFPPTVRIWLATAPVDLRQSFDTLAECVRQQLHGDPFSGHLFVFGNKRRDRVKLLYWDEDGFVIVYKKQEEECPHSFAFTEFGERAHNRALRLA
jgi:transposase